MCGFTSGPNGIYPRSCTGASNRPASSAAEAEACLLGLADQRLELIVGMHPGLRHVAIVPERLVQVAELLREPRPISRSIA